MEEDKRTHPPLDPGAAYLTDMTSSTNGLVLFGEGLILLDRWRNTPAYKDGNISMILGEWMQENRDELVALGAPPEDVGHVIAHLARRAHDHNYNRSDEWVKSGGTT